ncbi:hypothetical protein M3204_04620 [Mesobacillus subterraneus]|uniref:hypothetical protein n=1 Tax=Mesobacillus subterraneus TaxID=285983 RepID=UPI00203D6C0C|nr:hypothetical protein [Mesobacillus subterraneus]MCM3663674.1 hypothetical protein [Mesobacillus subterraneus]MCM3683439.1 hypothetical protein [Mesobacillus subterraneus]
MYKLYSILAISIIALSGIYIWVDKKNEFTTEKWINEPLKRGEIVDDLLTSYKMVGMTKKEVINLLGSSGEPIDMERPIGEREINGLNFNLGPEPGFMSIDDAWLIIYFDEDNRVSRYKLTTD